jgi:ligand-binding SRPBCC domain-containing protein
VPEFVRSVLINAPVDRVFRFHEQDNALALLSPGFPPVRIVSRTDGIAVGARVELRVGPFPWVALHTAYHRDRYFQDEQIEGPFARWVHTHEFQAVGAGTRLTDRIVYELPGGALVNRLLAWTVRLGLHSQFAHRHNVTKQVCEAPARSVHEPNPPISQ